MRTRLLCPAAARVVRARPCRSSWRAAGAWARYPRCTSSPDLQNNYSPSGLLSSRKMTLSARRNAFCSCRMMMKTQQMHPVQSMRRKNAPDISWQEPDPRHENDIWWWLCWQTRHWCGCRKCGMCINVWLELTQHSTEALSEEASHPPPPEDETKNFWLKCVPNRETKKRAGHRSTHRTWCGRGCPRGSPPDCGGCRTCGADD